MSRWGRSRVTPSLGEAQFRLERPAIVAEVEQLAVVVLSKGRGNLKTYADDKILLIERDDFSSNRHPALSL